MSKKKVVFVSTMTLPEWTAAEELWWRTAANLIMRGFSASASIVGCAPRQRVQQLKAAGIHVYLRPTYYPIWKRAWQYPISRGKTKLLLEVEKLLRREKPDLVVFSGHCYTPIELLELCVAMNLPFVTIANGNDDYDWPEDPLADRYRNALPLALRCYFVSNAILRLTEKQIGCELPNAKVVWSQFNVGFNSSPAWPASTLEGELRLACVARLYPAHKGQDILLNALASPVWENRPWHLTFYGAGPMRNTLERLAARLGLSNRVTFAGHVAVEEIWSANQVLVMPSRSEGGPLATIEAMLCGRPVLATDVGLHPEIIVDGVTGFLVEAPTVSIMADGLEKLWANRANLETMGTAGAKRIRELVPADPIRVFSEKIEDLIN